MVLLAAASGGVAAWVVWRYADAQLKSELSSGGDLLSQSLAQGNTQLTAAAQRARQQAQQAVAQAITSQVVPAVRAEVTRDLNNAGVTPAFIAEVKKVLALGQRVGVI
jgi:ubiquinone biosynthesis protein UbiJ